MEFVFLYAPLHDVGKIAIPEHILLKPGRLSAEEYEVMKKHVAAGMEIVESIASGFQVGDSTSRFSAISSVITMRPMTGPAISPAAAARTYR